MRVIAGLGNPGIAYINTPHNIGFDVVDVLAARLGAEWKNNNRFEAQVARINYAGAPLMLVKPQTFMNLSGMSVVPLMRYFGGEPEGLTVIVDDVDLPLGRLRIRAAGSSGGHRGMASIITALGSEEFGRIRLGMGRAQRRGVVDHVLGRFDEESIPVIRDLVMAATDAAQCLLDRGINEAMNRYNGWSAVVAEEPAGEEMES